jgi:putative FmdB family regulatory protein
MPIYEYRCSSCGFEEEYLQKVSAPLLTDCPKCKTATFAKKLSAAGFQLKGSGWYATDFKNNGAKPKDKAKSEGAKSDVKAESASDSKTESKTENKTAEASSPASSGASAIPSSS